MKKEDLPNLNKLISALSNKEKELEVSYEKRDSEDFKSAKRTLIEIQKRISKLLNN